MPEIELIINDRMGRKVRIKTDPYETIGDVKAKIAEKTGLKAKDITLKKWYTVFKDHMTIDDYSGGERGLSDGASIETDAVFPG